MLTLPRGPDGGSASGRARVALAVLFPRSETMAFPTKDAELVVYSTNWDTRLTASAADFGLTPAQATQYGTLHDAWIAAYNAWSAAIASGTRSESLTSAKNDAKKNLLFFGRQLYAFVQWNEAVSDSNRDLLQVVNRKTEPTPGPVPAMSPGIELKSVVGRTVNVRLFDTTDSANRGRPAGVSGASIFSAVSATP